MRLECLERFKALSIKVTSFLLRHWCWGLRFSPWVTLPLASELCLGSVDAFLRVIEERTEAYQRCSTGRSQRNCRDWGLRHSNGELRGNAVLRAASSTYVHHRSVASTAATLPACCHRVPSTSRIHLVTGLDMHLLVAFNVLLDLFMGCTSGGVKLSVEDRMLHFRTLDWGMDPLWKVIVQLEYNRDGVKVASVLTYVGYVGVLTGVRKALSISLNFRPVHNAST